MTGHVPNAGSDLSGFSWLPLPEKVHFQEGPGILAKDFTGAGVPLVRLSGLGGYEVTIKGCNFVSPDKGIGKWGHFRLKKGDILVSTSASFGRPAVVGEEAQGAIFYTGLIRFTPRTSDLDAGYLKAFLGSELFMRQAEALASGSVIRHFGPSHLREMRIPVPPLSDQRAIAAILGALDDKIELNRQVNETLEAMARALFRDWFVDFGPTRAKMAGQAPYLSPALWDLFPANLDDEGRPEGWTLGKMSDLFTLQRGFDLPSQDRHDGPYQILAASGPNGFHDTFMVKGPGVTTGRSGVLGKVFYVHEDFWPLNTSLWVKDYHRATPRFAYYFLELMDLGGFNAGSAVPTLNRNHVHGLPTVIPPGQMVQAFDHIAQGLMARQRQNELETRTLAQTRDLLLPRLMSGELKLQKAKD